MTKNIDISCKRDTRPLRRASCAGLGSIVPGVGIGARLLRGWWRWLVLGVVMLGGCVTMPRRPPPPALINSAAPAGFNDGVRLLSVNRRRYMQQLPGWMADLKRAARGKPINILVLSGGGSYGAFGAGALVGLSQVHARPQFDLVTGVSAGALLAPFAFLGPDWDARLREVFTSGALESLQSSRELGALKLMLFPRGIGDRDSLAALVDRFISNAMIDAVARQAETGRQLWVATTDLDDQETMLWNMGAIAERGSRAADRLFRKILVASASIPGMFPPVLIPVTQDGRTYDEMQVDGSITTPLFIAPVIALTTPAESGLSGAHVYVIVNGRMGRAPSETPVNTMRILADSFSAQLIYNTREAFNGVMALAQRDQMQMVFTSIPSSYPAGSFLNFHRKHLLQLFDYGEACARHGMLWTSAALSVVQRDVYQDLDDRANSLCPGAVSTTYFTSE